MNRRCILAALALLPVAGAAGAQMLRESFATGARTSPAGWTLAGNGEWRKADRSGKRALAVIGNGDDQSAWTRTIPWLKPCTAYRIDFTACATPGSSPSTLVSGLDVCNRDYGVGQPWQDYSFFFTTPADVSRAFARLGQWHLKGAILFRNVRLCAVDALHNTRGRLTLGEGEGVVSSVYRFSAPLAGPASNSSRCLETHTAPFNSNRWCFGSGSQVTYRHSVAGSRFRGGSVKVNVNYYVGGALAVEASADGGPWAPAGSIEGQKVAVLKLPAALFPASELRIRLRAVSAASTAGNSAPGDLQIDLYDLTAQLETPISDMQGWTRYATPESLAPTLEARIVSLSEGGPSRAAAARVVLTNRGRTATTVTARAAITSLSDARSSAGSIRVAKLAPGQTAIVSLPFHAPAAGRFRVLLTARQPGASQRWVTAVDGAVASYERTDYGSLLANGPGGALWWCEAGFKVPPQRPAPGAATTAPAVTLRAAGGERRHAQIVLRPGRDLGAVIVSLGPLRRAGGGTIAQDRLSIREVSYVRVTQVTDAVGQPGLWPDPLAPLEGGMWRPKPGMNNALWLTIETPPDARPGDYTGQLALTAPGFKQVVPLRLHVWGFTLPARTTLRSGFGIDAGNIRRYHNIRSGEAMDKQWQLYMEAFAKRRIAPYNPMALAPFNVKLAGTQWTGGIRRDGSAPQGRRYLEIADTSTISVADARYVDLIPVAPGRSYRITWQCKTGDAGRQAQVSLGQHDSSRTWMSGRNMDLTVQGSIDWATGGIDITPSLTPATRFLSLVVRPTVWTENGAQTGSACFDDVRLTCVETGEQMVADGGFESSASPKVEIDFTEFDKAASRYLDGLGFNAFTVLVPGLGNGRHPTYDPGSFLGYAVDTPEYDALMTDFGKQFEDHLAARGWLRKAYVYWYDEPEVNDYPFVTNGMERLRKYTPRLKRMLTEEFQPELTGHVQLWCPITPAYTSQAAAKRQTAGDEVWWYVCTGPKEPYCTLFIDHPGIEMRMWLWQTWKYRVQGILIWETTYWNSWHQSPDKPQDPWSDPMSYVAAPTGVWGNGDGRFFYPPRPRPGGDELVAEPVVSMRWELLGDGIQDWEQFRLLADLVKRPGKAPAATVAAARKLLVIPEAICKDMTHFTEDPRALDVHRDRVAQAIETLAASRARK
jgi:hypothetical protein